MLHGCLLFKKAASIDQFPARSQPMGLCWGWELHPKPLLLSFIEKWPYSHFSEQCAGLFDKQGSLPGAPHSVRELDPVSWGGPNAACRPYFAQAWFREANCTHSDTHSRAVPGSRDTS